MLRAADNRLVEFVHVPKLPGSEVKRPVDWKKASHFRPHTGIQFPMGPG